MSDVVRFFSHADQTGGDDACWNWTASFGSTGYGAFRVAGRTVKAHRWILGVLRGAPLRWDETVREEACHRCDNPACVNPAHLYVGDRLANARDAVSRDRLNPWGRLISECKRGHPLSGENLRIDARRKRRVCRACARDWARRKRNLVRALNSAG